MAFLDHILEPPKYGFIREGKFYKPTSSEIFREFFSRLNVFKSKKNWLSLFSWVVTCSLTVPFFVFIFKYFSFKLLFVGFIYSMVLLGTHGTIWLHRYGTHRGFVFSHPLWRLLTRNLVIRIIPEEIYIISHHVHHQYSEKPGDPYNVNGGWLYCFLADVTHQPIAQNLSRIEYDRLHGLMSHTGVRLNSYEQYQKWGSLCHPFFAIGHYLLSWGFWFAVFYVLGGMALVTAIFGISVIWAFGVRTYNYDGHGRGIDRRKEGSDFNRDDLSVNQIWPGYVAGEWHNNHHLYPNGARSGFLPHQLDLAWIYIYSLYKIGAVRSYRDYKEEFLEKHYLPFKLAQSAQGNKITPITISNLLK